MVLRLAFILIVLGGGMLWAQDAHQQLHDLFNETWEEGLKRNPVQATYMGDKRYNHLWQDLSLKARAQNHQYQKDILKRLGKIPFDQLSPEDQINYKLFEQQIKMAIEGYQYQFHLIPLNQRGGIQTTDNILRSMNFSTVKDYEDWIARLESFGSQIDQTIELMREGIVQKVLPPKVIMKRIPRQIEVQIVADPSESGFYGPFANMPETIKDGATLKTRAQAAIRDHVIPGYKRFKTFFNEEYLPACYDKVGIVQWQRGKEAYAYRARFFTTTDLTPEQIHEIGLSEVKRIRAQMMEIIKEVEFEGDFDAFLNFLRTDPQFYYKTPEELHDAYLALSKRIDPTLVKLFGKMPRMPYGVTPIPDAIAPDTTTAYYNRPAPDGSRAGQYYVNLYKPETRPKYEMEALSIHEAVPGHHFQIALAMELGDLPNFRRFGGFTAFVEGWALYSESLGEELGFYQDPYSKFGQLTYEMWRAVRLVVDTGMHYYGWDRQKAIDFFKANAAKSEADIINEIDRYIAWPGQALAYKIGELKIKELRKRATENLGDQFDIRAFHDELLSIGAVSLDVLEAHMDAWMARVKKGD